LSDQEAECYQQKANNLGVTEPTVIITRTLVEHFGGFFSYSPIEDLSLLLLAPAAELAELSSKPKSFSFDTLSILDVVRIFYFSIPLFSYHH
jgi:hypothetical protein